jgi:hypothetical protein
MKLLADKPLSKLPKIPLTLHYKRLFDKSNKLINKLKKF